MLVFISGRLAIQYPTCCFTSGGAAAVHLARQNLHSIWINDIPYGIKQFNRVPPLPLPQISFRLARPGMMKAFEGHWSVHPYDGVRVVQA